MRTEDAPYPECDKCRTLTDCKHIDKGGGVETDMPPDSCPKPTDVMRHTLHKRKLDRNKKYS